MKYKLKLSRWVFSLSIGQMFLLLAMILFILASVILVMANEKQANRIIILTYFLLILGVLNLIIEYVIEDIKEYKLFNIYPEVRLAISLFLLGILIHFTPELGSNYPHMDKGIFLASLIIVLLPKLRWIVKK